ncbi:MAG TPA: hypothetical protein VES39_03760 [Rhodospirillales bacterium]|nr:hypothetical protein [Rhodospirillales bacterium]
MPSDRRRWLLRILLASCLGTGSTPAAAEPPFFVYRDAGSPDNHGAWTNVVPAGAGEALRIDLAAPGDGGTAVRLAFDLVRARWSGIVVASAPGYWGAEPGPGFGLAGARALVFRARGERGSERIRIKAAVAGDQPYGDSAPLPLDAGWITLTTGWQEFRIDATGSDLARVVTPFMVIANDKHNPGGRITVYLDDIRWERGG